MLLAAALVGLVLVGLRQAGDPGAGDAAKRIAPARPFDLAEARRELRGAPPALAALHAQANRGLDGGPRAFERRLAALKGHPVVVNQWAWWCGPCKREAPHLQQAATTYGRRVAFVGINVDSTRADAAKFHAKFPMPFPSYFDPDRDVIDRLGDIVDARLSNTPTTVFIDAAGRPAYLRQGEYSSRAELAADIERYLEP